MRDKETTNTEQTGALPSALTVFLSAAQRRQVVRALKKIDARRDRAILRALKLDALIGPDHSEGAGS